MNNKTKNVFKPIINTFKKNILFFLHIFHLKLLIKMFIYASRLFTNIFEQSFLQTFLREKIKIYLNKLFHKILIRK